jgi:hypothetical protein
LTGFFGPEKAGPWFMRAIKINLSVMGFKKLFFESIMILGFKFCNSIFV